ncbi:MAG: beta-N-acetylhexosaminidase [Bacteroidetes bacterium]|nr:MAG: beta-N-acetylhexosaminidase [Bacteroidota bacterium]
MLKRILGIILVLSISIQLIGQSKKKSVNFDPKSLSISWEVITNSFNNQSKFQSAFVIKNNGKAAVPASGWKIYFNLARNVDAEPVTGGVNITHVNGDLFIMSPNSGFKSIAPNDSLRIEFVSADWVVNFTDAPLGLYWVWDNDADKGIALENYSIKPSTQARQYLRTPDDKVGLITPQIIYDQNKNTRDIPESELPKIFPTPLSVKMNQGKFQLDATVSILPDPEFRKEAEYLAKEITPLVNGKIVVNTSANSGKLIYLRKTNLPADAYQLKVSSDSIFISASNGAGIFYGIQSLRSAIAPQSWSSPQNAVQIDAMEVSDAPRFGFRSFMLDVARNFQTKQEVLRVLDLMALYKLNVFHFHLTEDEGWRLEIPGLPELTDFGSKRGHSAGGKKMLMPAFGSGPDPVKGFGSGYYTRNDFIEILKYAEERHISVIPEIESPGHARAAIKSMFFRYDKYMAQGKKDEAVKYLLQDPNDKSKYESAQLWSDNVMDPAMPSTYYFIEKVIDELIAMYKEANAPLKFVHLGGDEVPAGVWSESPSYKSLKEKNPDIQSPDDLWYYYYGKLDQILKAKSLLLYGWEEMAMRKTKLDGEKTLIPNPDFVRDHWQVDVWNNVLGWGAEDLAYKLANAGYKVVLSPVSNLYFDMAYYKAFEEPGYYWGGFIDVDKPFYFIPYDYFKNAKEDRMGGPLDRSIFVGKTRLTDYGKSNIVGIQGLLWGENDLGPQRLEYLLLPKLLGMAERAWAKDPEWATTKDATKSDQLFNEAWNIFANQVGKRELKRLDYYKGGYGYRIPSPGAMIAEGKVVANLQLPGMVIRYTTDGSDPIATSKIYNGPISEKGLIKLKAFDTRGRSGRVSEIRNP